MLKVAVTGMGGQLALALRSLKTSQVDLTFYSKDDWDITNEDNTRKILDSQKWDALINTAAYTAVDLAEIEETAAYEVNDHATSLLGKYCADHGIHLIHISSDYVYHNELLRPLREDDPTTPKGIYARSKLAGEQGLLNIGGRTTIIRTSWIYSPYGKNFVKTMCRLLKEKDRLNVVCDQHGVPTAAGDLAEMIINLLVNETSTNVQGATIYNYAPKGWTTWYGITKQIKEILGSTCEVVPIPSNEYPTPAMRPTNSILNCDKIDGLGLGERLDWKVSLEETVREIVAFKDQAT